MKNVISVDNRGYKRIYSIRDKDNDKDAKLGIPIGPPDISSLDWDLIGRDINNELVDKGLITWDDVVRSQNGLSQVIVSIVRRKIVELYRK